MDDLFLNDIFNLASFVGIYNKFSIDGVIIKTKNGQMITHSVARMYVDDDNLGVTFTDKGYSEFTVKGKFDYIAYKNTSISFGSDNDEVITFVTKNKQETQNLVDWLIKEGYAFTI